MGSNPGPVDSTPMIKELWNQHKELRKDTEIAYIQGKSSARARALTGGHKEGSEGYQQAMKAVDRQYDDALQRINSDGPLKSIKKFLLTTGGSRQVLWFNDSEKGDKRVEQFAAQALDLAPNHPANNKAKYGKYEKGEERDAAIATDTAAWQKEVDEYDLGDRIRQEIEADREVTRPKNVGKNKSGVGEQKQRMLGSAAKLSGIQDDEETNLTWAA